MARGSVKLSILSSYDDKGTQQAEKAMERFAKKYGVLSKENGKTTASLHPLTTALAQQSIAFDQAAAKWAGYSKKAANISRSLAPLSAAAAGIGAAAIKMAADYEQGLAKVMTIADRTKVTAQEMGEALLQVSTETGRSVTEIQEATYQALSASVDTAKSVDFVRTAVNLSKAGFTSTTTAVDVLTTAINAYGLSAEDAAALSDKLVNTQNKGKTTVDELGQSLGQVIPTAAAYGVSIDQLLTGYVQLTKQGINTANSTTYLNRMLTELNKSGSTVDTTLRAKTGKGFKELMDSGASLGDVMQILKDSVDGDSVAFANLWGSAVAGRGALAIANAGAEEFNTQLKAMEGSAGTVDDALKNLKTPASEANKAINALKNTGIQLGEVFMAALAPAAERAKEAAQGLYDWFAKLDDGTKQNIARMIAFTAALAPAFMVFSKFAGIVSNGYKILGTITGAFAKMTAQTYANVAATQGMNAATSMSSAQLAKQTVATKAATVATKAQAVAMNLAKSAIVAMVMAGVVLAIQKFNEWREEQEQLRQATTGLENAQRRATQSFQFAAEGAEQTAISYGEMHDRASEVIARQAEMAQSITDTFSEANRSRAELDHYNQTIQELANKSNLTTDEQASLVRAVEGLNEAMGTSYSVVDAANGVIADQEGIVLDNVDAINKLVEAKKREIQAEALATAAKEAYKAQADAANELVQAEANLSQAQENYNKALNEQNLSPEEVMGYTATIEAAQGEVDRLRAAHESATDAANAFDDQLQLIKMGELGDELASAITNTDGFSTAMTNSGKSTKKFYDQLKKAGVTGKDFAKLTSDQLSKIAAKYDGELSSIENELKQYGINVKNAETATKQTTTNMGNAIQNSGVPQKAQAMMTSAVNNLVNGAKQGAVAGMTLSTSTANGVNVTAANGKAVQLASNAVAAAKGAANGAPAGSALSSSTAGGVNTRAANSKAVQLMNNAVAAAKGVSGYSAGYNFGSGLASGMNGAVGLVRNAASYLATQAKAKFDNTMESRSPSREMIKRGLWFDQGLAIGIERNADLAVRSAEVMADRTKQAATIQAAAPMLQAAGGGSFDSVQLVASVDRLTARVDELYMNLGRTIADNAPVVVEPEREFARRVRKAVAYE